MQIIALSCTFRVKHRCQTPLHNAQFLLVSAQNLARARFICRCLFVALPKTFCSMVLQLSHCPAYQLPRLILMGPNKMGFLRQTVPSLWRDRRWRWCFWCYLPNLRIQSSDSVVESVIRRFGPSQNLFLWRSQAKMHMWLLATRSQLQCREKTSPWGVGLLGTSIISTILSRPPATTYHILLNATVVATKPLAEFSSHAATSPILQVPLVPARRPYDVGNVHDLAINCWSTRCHHQTPQELKVRNGLSE